MKKIWRPVPGRVKHNYKHVPHEVFRNMKHIGKKNVKVLTYFIGRDFNDKEKNIVKASEIIRFTQLHRSSVYRALQSEELKKYVKIEKVGTQYRYELVRFDGSVKIPDFYLHEVMPRLNCEEWMQLFYMLKFFYGFGKSRPPISYYTIRKYTGLGRSTISKGLDLFYKLGFLSKIYTGSPGEGSNIYKLFAGYYEVA